MIHRFSWALAVWLSTVPILAQPRPTTKAVRRPKTVDPPDQVQVEPVILTRFSLDDKIVPLRLAPRIATSIRLPEPVNSVVVGDPQKFQAEHSEHEPNLVTVKPVTDQPAQTNLLITTALGHQLNILLTSAGSQVTGSQQVDVLLTYGAKSGSFLIEESAFPTSLVPETTSLDRETKAAATVAAGGPIATQLASLLKTGGGEARHWELWGYI